MKITWKKRFVSAALALTMLLSFLPANILPQAEAATWDNYFEIVSFTQGTGSNAGKFQIKYKWKQMSQDNVTYTIALLPNFGVKEGSVLIDETNAYTQLTGGGVNFETFMSSASNNNGANFASWGRGGPIYWFQDTRRMDQNSTYTIEWTNDKFVQVGTDEKEPLLADAITNYLNSMGGGYTPDCNLDLIPYGLVIYSESVGSATKKDDILITPPQEETEPQLEIEIDSLKTKIQTGDNSGSATLANLLKTLKDRSTVSNPGFENLFLLTIHNSGTKPATIHGLDAANPVTLVQDAGNTEWILSTNLTGAAADYSEETSPWACTGTTVAGGATVTLTVRPKSGTYSNQVPGWSGVIKIPYYDGTRYKDTLETTWNIERESNGYQIRLDDIISSTEDLASTSWSALQTTKSEIRVGQTGSGNLGYNVSQSKMQSISWTPPHANMVLTVTKADGSEVAKLTGTTTSVTLGGSPQLSVDGELTFTLTAPGGLPARATPYTGTIKYTYGGTLNAAYMQKANISVKVDGGKATQLEAPELTATRQSNATTPNGTITVTNTGDYPSAADVTFVLKKGSTTVASNKTGVFTGLEAGDYTVTATTTNTAYSNSTATSVTVDPPLEYTVSATAKSSISGQAGGTVKVGSSAAGANSSAKVTENDPVTLVAAESTGYTFKEWQNSSGTKVSGDKSYTIEHVTANASYTAVFEPILYTVTFDPNGASGAANPASAKQATPGAAVNLAAVGTMSKAGYTFGGWSTTKGGSALSDSTYTPTEDITLYAVWDVVGMNYSGKALKAATYGDTSYSDNVATATGGSGSFTYSKGADFPDWLDLNTSTGALTLASGKTLPDASNTPYTVNVVATDTNTTQSKSAAFTIKVNKRNITLSDVTLRGGLIAQTTPVTDDISTGTATSVNASGATITNVISGGATLAGTWNITAPASYAASGNATVTFTPADTTNYNSATVTILYTATPQTRSLTIEHHDDTTTTFTAGGSHAETVTYGYTASDVKTWTVRVTNNGNMPITNFKITGSGDTTAFTVADNNTYPMTLAAGASVTFTVKANTGLNYKTTAYTETFNMTGDNGVTGSYAANLTVGQKALESVTIQSNAADKITVQQGSVLSVDTLTPTGATVTYQWQSRTGTSGNFSNISGATNATYTVTDNDAGKQFQLVVTGTGNYSETKTSNQLGPANYKAAITLKEDGTETAGYTVILREKGGSATVPTTYNTTSKKYETAAGALDGSKSYDVMVYAIKGNASSTLKDVGDISASSRTAAVDYYKVPFGTVNTTALNGRTDTTSYTMSATADGGKTITTNTAVLKDTTVSFALSNATTIGSMDYNVTWTNATGSGTPATTAAWTYSGTRTEVTATLARNTYVVTGQAGSGVNNSGSNRITISGTALDGAPISAITGTGTPSGTGANSNGSISFANVPAGTYTVAYTLAAKTTLDTANSNHIPETTPNNFTVSSTAKTNVFKIATIASTYTISITEGGSATTGNSDTYNYKYGTVETHTVTVTNTGNAPLNNFTITGSADANFDIDMSNVTALGGTLPVGGSVTFTVALKPGRNAGSYSDTFTVAATDLTSTAKTYAYSATVNKLTLPNVTLTHISNVTTTGGTQGSFKINDYTGNKADYEYRVGSSGNYAALPAAWQIASDGTVTVVGVVNNADTVYQVRQALPAGETTTNYNYGSAGSVTIHSPDTGYIELTLTKDGQPYTGRNVHIGSATGTQLRETGSSGVYMTPAAGVSPNTGYALFVDEVNINETVAVSNGNTTKKTVAFYTVTVTKDVSAATTTATGGVRLEESTTGTTTTFVSKNGNSLTLNATAATGYGGTATWDATVGSNTTHPTTGSYSVSSATAPVTLTAKFTKNVVTVTAKLNGDVDTAFNQQIELRVGAEAPSTGSFGAAKTPVSGVATFEAVPAETAFNIYVGRQPTGITVTATAGGTVNVNLNYYKVKLADSISNGSATLTGGITRGSDTLVLSGGTNNSVNLAATPADNYRFDNWTVDPTEATGSLGGTTASTSWQITGTQTNPYTAVVTDAIVITPHFVLDSLPAPTVTAVKVDNTSGQITGISIASNVNVTFYYVVDTNANTTTIGTDNAIPGTASGGTASATGLPKALTGLNPNTHYYVHVVAVSNGVTSAVGHADFYTDYTVVVNTDTHGSVSVDSGAASKISQSFAKEAGSTMTLSTTPDSGYVFKDWTDSRSVINGSTLTVPATKGGGNGTITVTANFIATYGVQYNLNGATSGTAPTDSNTYREDASVTLTSTTPTRNGYTFGGWSLTAGGTTALTSPVTIATMKSAQSSVTPGGKFTLYAIWTSDSWDVTVPSLDNPTFNMNTSSTGAPSWLSGVDMNGWVNAGGSGNYTITKGNASDPVWNWLDITSDGKLKLKDGARVGDAKTWTFGIQVIDTDKPDGDNKRTPTVTVTVDPAQPVIESFSYAPGSPDYYKDPVAVASKITAVVKDPYTGAVLSYTGASPKGEWTATPAAFDKQDGSSETYTFTYTVADSDKNNYLTATTTANLTSIKRNPTLTVGNHGVTDPAHSTDYKFEETIKYNPTAGTKTVTVDISHLGNSPVTALAIAQTTNTGNKFTNLNKSKLDAVSTTNTFDEGDPMDFTFNVPTGGVDVGDYTLTYRITGTAAQGGDVDTPNPVLTYTYVLHVEPAELDYATLTLTAPAAGSTGDSTPGKSGANMNNYTGAVAWTPSASFTAGQQYTATITLTPNKNYIFVDPNATGYSVNGTVATPGGTSDGQGGTVAYSVAADGSRVTLTYEFAALPGDGLTITAKKLGYDSGEVTSISAQAALNQTFYYAVTTADVDPAAVTPSDLKNHSAAGLSSGLVKYGSGTGTLNSGTSTWTGPDSLTGLKPHTTYYVYATAQAENGTGGFVKTNKVSFTTDYKVTVVATEGGSISGGATVPENGSVDLAVTTSITPNATPKNTDGWAFKEWLVDNSPYNGHTTTSSFAYTPTAAESTLTADFHKKIYGVPLITGTVGVGETLTATVNAGSGEQVGIGDGPITDAQLVGENVEYKWEKQVGSNWVTVGTDSSTYVVTAADAGAKFRVTITYKGDPDVDGNFTHVTSRSTNANIVPLQPPTVELEPATGNNGGLTMTITKSPDDENPNNKVKDYTVKLVDKTTGQTVDDTVVIPANGSGPYTHTWDLGESYNTPKDLDPTYTYEVIVVARPNDQDSYSNSPEAKSTEEPNPAKRKVTSIDYTWAERTFNGGYQLPYNTAPSAVSGGDITVTSTMQAASAAKRSGASGASTFAVLADGQQWEAATYDMAVSVAETARYEGFAVTNAGTWTIKQDGATMSENGRNHQKKLNVAEAGVDLANEFGITTKYNNPSNTPVGACNYASATGDVTGHYNYSFELIAVPSGSSLTTEPVADPANFKADVLGDFKFRVTATYVDSATAAYKEDVAVPDPITVTLPVIDQLVTGIKLEQNTATVSGQYGTPNGTYMDGDQSNVDAKLMDRDGLKITVTFDEGEPWVIVIGHPEDSTHEFPEGMTWGFVDGSVAGEPSPANGTHIQMKKAGSTGIYVTYKSVDSNKDVTYNLSPKKLEYSTTSDVTEKIFDGTTDVPGGKLALDETSKVEGDNVTLTGNVVLSSREIGDRKIITVGTPTIGGTDRAFYTVDPITADSPNAGDMKVIAATKPILKFKDTVDTRDYSVADTNPNSFERSYSGRTDQNVSVPKNLTISLKNFRADACGVVITKDGSLADKIDLTTATVNNPMTEEEELTWTTADLGIDTSVAGTHTLILRAEGKDVDGAWTTIATYTFTVRITQYTPPSTSTTVTIEMPVVTYWVSDYGITNDLTAEKMSRKGAKPSFVPQITPIEGLKFLGWSETDPTTIKDGKLPTLVDPLTFTINDDKTFYAIYAREGYDHNHYVIGFPDGTFGPDLPITRAQVATIIARSCLGGFVEGYDYGNPGGYTDVPSKHWASSAIAFCTKSGTFNGYNDGTFQPDKNISRQELATVVARLAGVQTNQGLPFVDSADVSGWALGGVYTAYANGWIVGYKDGTFLPKNDITRAETVKIFNAYLNRGVNAEGLSDLKEYVHSGVASNNTENGSTEYMTWPDVPATHWAYFEVIEAANDHNFHWADQSAEVPPEHWEEAFINEIWNYHDAAGTTVPTAPPVQKYTVTYVLGDHGTTWASLNEEVEAGKAPVSVPYVSANEGYTFIGWSETADGTYHVDPASFTVNGNKTYYAVYEEVEVQYEIKSHTAYASGVNRSEFHPDEAVARGDVAYMLANMMGYDSSVEYDTSGLSDVEGHWARNAIGYCVEEGLLSGYTDGTFLPDGTMTRQEFAVILSRLVGLETAEGDLPFTDAGEIKNWAKDAIYTAYTSGLMSGYTDGSFQPTRTVTRAEAVKVFNSYLGREVDRDSILAAPARWTDVSVTHWAYCDIMEATVDHDWYGLDATEFWTVEE